MAVVLSSALKIDGTFYEEGTDVKDLPKKVAKAAKDLGILMAVVDEVDLEELESEEEEAEAD